jgi:magnesium-protoporphyrin IX monomethyl ester (oxidative) cyclase
MYVRDHARPEFHKALGVDIEWYDQEVFKKTSAIARQVFPIEIDIDNKRWLPNLRRMRDAFIAMDAAKKRGGVSGYIGRMVAGAAALRGFVAIYTMPVIKTVPPANVRMEPVY